MRKDVHLTCKVAVICHCYNSKICLLHTVIVKDELHTVVISYCKHVIGIVKIQAL